MSPEKAPAEGTNLSRVLGAIREGIPRKDLPGHLNMDKRTISYTIQGLRHAGYLNRPTTEETKKAMQESSREARGSIWEQVEPYARMGMTPRMVRHALLI